MPKEFFGIPLIIVENLEAEIFGGQDMALWGRGGGLGVETGGGKL